MNNSTFQKNYLFISAYCAAQERCKKEVREKLAENNTEKVDIEALIELLEQENFLNEKRYAQSYARDKCRFNKWGKVKIAYELRTRGIDSETIEYGLSSIDEKFYKELIKHLASRKWEEIRHKPLAKQALFRYLAQKGFENDRISEVIRSL